MSRAFVKEDAEADAKVVLPAKPISPHPNYVTPHGLQELQRLHREASDELLAIAGDQSGDGRQRKAQLERELRYLEARLKSAIPVEPGSQPPDVVRFGATVTALDEEGEERCFTIVGEDEANIAAGQISWVSPLAKALQGATVGDVVAWVRPAGEIDLEVTAIEYRA